MVIYLKYFLLIVLFALIQKYLIWLIAIGSYQITPDLVIIGLAIFGIRFGKVAGTVAGFLIGIIIDLFSLTFVGLMALSKTSAGFMSGYFNNENKLDSYLKGYFFILIVALCSLINNTIYFWFYFQGTALTFIDILIKYVITTTLYTALISSLFVITRRKKILIR